MNKMKKNRYFGSLVCFITFEFNQFEYVCHKHILI